MRSTRTSIANAGVLMDAGGAIRLPQAEFTPDRLAAEIAALAAEPARLAAMAGGRQAGRRASTPPTGWPIWCLRVAGVIPR